MINTPPRDHRPPRPRRAPVAVVDDAVDNASGIFSTSGTISECTMASFLLESNSRTNNKPNHIESPRHQMSPNTAALLRRKQEDARVAILSLNQFIFQAGNLYRGKRLNRDEENILRESAYQVGLSLDIVDALLEHTSDSNAVVQYCMESEDSFAMKIRKDRRLSQLLKQDASEPEGNFNLKSSIWRILMHKIVQQTLRDHGMDIGDVMDKSLSTTQLYGEASHNDEYAINSAERERYGRDYTEERKRVTLPEDEIKNARHRAIAQMEFHQSKGPFDCLQNRDDIPLMIGAGPAAECRDDDMSHLDAHDLEHREMTHPTQRPQSSPLTPRSLNVQQQRNDRTPPPGRTHQRGVDPTIDQNNRDENDYGHTQNENRPPHSSATSRQAPLSAVKRALAMFEGPGKFDQDHSQKQISSTPKARKGSSSKIADRLALWEKGVQPKKDSINHPPLERVKSSEHQAIQATSLFDVFSTPQKQSTINQQHPRAASTSRISKVKRAQIAAFENRGSETKAESNERIMLSEVKKLDPSRRRLFDESGDKPERSSSRVERRTFDNMDNVSQQPEAAFYQSGYQQGNYPQHVQESGEGKSDSEHHVDDPADNIGELKQGWRKHSTPPPKNQRGSHPRSKKHVTFGESPKANPIRQQGSFSDPQKSAMDKILKKARTPPKPPTPSKKAQRSLQIRERLLANMNATKKDEHHQVTPHQPVPSDNISINSYHSMDESLDPTSIQDYGPRREIKRTPRPKRRNIQEENFLEDERVRIEPPDHQRNEMFYFDSFENIPKAILEEDSLMHQAMNQDREFQDVSRTMVEEDSLMEHAMNQDQEYQEAMEMMEEDSLMEQAMNRDREYQDIARNMMEEDSLMEHAMNADAHHSNVLVSETLSSSPGNSNGLQDQFSNFPVDEDDPYEEQAYVSEMASSRAASNQVPIDSMISSMSSGELIQAPGSQSTMTDDGNRSWVEFNQVFESIHGARSEVTQVESGLTSSRKSIESMFDTLHQVKQEAFSMERRKPEREARETQKPMETYHPVTPRAPKVYHDNFFEDVRLSGSKARFQVTHNDSESARYDANDKSQHFDHEQRNGVNSNTQVLNVPQTDPEEWAYFQNSHFHSDASSQEQELDIEEHVSDITDPRDMPKADPSEADSMDPVVQVSHEKDVTMTASTLSDSTDESNFDMNPYKSNVATVKGLSLSAAYDKAKKMASKGARLDEPPSNRTEDPDPQTRRKSSPRYPRSPVFDKAMQKARKHSTKESLENLEQDPSPMESEVEKPKEKESSPRYPRSPAFDKALQARKTKANDDEQNSQLPRQEVSFDYHVLPPPPSLEEAFNLVDTETEQDSAFHRAKTPRTSHGNAKSTTNRLNSIEMQNSSSSLSRFLRIDTSCSEEDDVGLNVAPASGQQSLRQDAVSNRDKAHGGRGVSPSAYRSYSEANEDVKAAAQASGVPQQIIDIILKQAAEHEKELEEAATEADRISWDAIAKKTSKAKQRATEVESPVGYTAKSEAFYSLPKQKKTKPIKLDVSLIPDDIPEGVSREDVKLLERFIQLSTSKFEGKSLSANSEARVRAAAINVGLAEDVIDQMLEQARWQREQRAAEEDSLHQPREDNFNNHTQYPDTLHQPQENNNNNNNTQHQYYSDTSDLYVHFEDHSTRHKFGGASPVNPSVYTESPGYTVPRDQRWSSQRRRSEGYNRNACNDPCRTLGNIKDNLLYWMNCQGGGSYDEEEYSITGDDLQF